MGEKVMYDTIFARSFSRSDQKKLGYAAFLGCLLIALSFCLVFNPYSTFLPLRNRLNNVSEQKRTKLVCSSEKRTELCEIKGDIRIEANSATVFVSVSPQESILLAQENNNKSRIIRPYARKEDEYALSTVRKWSVKPVSDTKLIPKCNQNHRVAAILFSLGGYSGNNYHDFTDIIIPLFSTARVFDGQVKFLVADKNPGWWVNKFQNLVQRLSNYEVVYIDNETDIHCFNHVIVGLKRSPQELSIDPSSESSPAYSMKDFRQLLRNAYSLNKTAAIKLEDQDKYSRRPPRLLIVARNRTRSFTNTDEIAAMGRNLGYQVIVAEADSNVTRFAQVVNSCDVMMGVHGAGLTNMVFLPDNAILIQIIPFGVAEWIVRDAFKYPSDGMNISYLDYKIQAEESSLIEQYPAGHEVLSNPISILKKGWVPFKEVYLDKQNVKLDVNRFRLTLVKALELLHQ